MGCSCCPLGVRGGVPRAHSATLNLTLTINSVPEKQHAPEHGAPPGQAAGVGGQIADAGGQGGEKNKYKHRTAAQPWLKVAFTNTWPFMSPPLYAARYSCSPCAAPASMHEQIAVSLQGVRRLIVHCWAMGRLGI